MESECLSQTHSVIHMSKLGFLLSEGCHRHNEEREAHWEKILPASVMDRR